MFLISVYVKSMVWGIPSKKFIGFVRDLDQEIDFSESRGEVDAKMAEIRLTLDAQRYSIGARYDPSLTAGLLFKEA